MKRIISILLVFIMLLSVTSISIFAENINNTVIIDGYVYVNGELYKPDTNIIICIDDIYYQVEKNTGKATNFTGIYENIYITNGKRYSTTVQPKQLVIEKIVYSVTQDGILSLYSGLYTNKQNITYEIINGNINKQNKVTVKFYGGKYYSIAKSGQATLFTGIYNNMYFANGKRYIPTTQPKQIVIEKVVYSVTSDGILSLYSGLYTNKQKITYEIINGNIHKQTKVTVKKYNGIYYSIAKSGQATTYTGKYSNMYITNGKQYIPKTLPKNLVISKIVYSVSEDGFLSLYSGLYTNKQNITYEIKNGNINKQKNASVSVYNGKPYSIAKTGQATLLTGLYKSLVYKNGVLGNGFVTAGTKTYYVKNGVRFTGLQKINNQPYFFDKNGVLQKTAVVYIPDAGYKGYFFANSKGIIDFTITGAIRSNGKNFLVTKGKARVCANTADNTLFRAYGVVNKVTKKSMTKAQKLKACWNHIKTSYTELNPRIPHFHGKDWQYLYANDVFIHKKGNCISFGCAFAFCAKAIGYTNVYCCHSGGHGWAEINGKIYDPEWSMHHSNYSYYGMSYNTKCDQDYKGAIAAGYSWMHVRIA